MHTKRQTTKQRTYKTANTKQRNNNAEKIKMALQNSEFENNDELASEYTFFWIMVRKQRIITKQRISILAHRD